MSALHVLALLGQSNVVGRGRMPPDVSVREPHRRILEYPGSGPERGTLRIAREPLSHHQPPKPETIGFSLELANRLLPSLPPGDRIVLVPAGHGNTGFSTAARRGLTWDPAVNAPDVINLFAHATSQVEGALRHPSAHLRAIMWHQGEADEEMEPHEYATKLDSLILGLRGQFGTRVPFIAGRMAPEALAHRPRLRAIDEVHRTLPTRHDRVGVWNGTPGMVNSAEDYLHYNACGQTLNGRAAARMLQEVEGS